MRNRFNRSSTRPALGSVVHRAATLLMAMLILMSLGVITVQAQGSWQIPPAVACVTPSAYGCRKANDCNGGLLKRNHNVTVYSAWGCRDSTLTGYNCYTFDEGCCAIPAPIPSCIAGSCPCPYNPQ